MKKEYTIKIDNYKITFETKPKNVAIKRALVEALWNSPLSTIHTLMDIITTNGSKVVSDTASYQKLGNIMRGEKFIHVVDTTTVKGVHGSTYESYSYKLNHDFIKLEMIKFI